MDTATLLAAVALVLGLAGPIAYALLRFSVAQVELRLVTAERRLEALSTALALQETKLAVVTSEHGGTARALARIEVQLERLTAQLLGGRGSSHEKETD